MTLETNLFTTHAVVEVAFSQPDYDVNEGDDTVEVCVDLIRGIPQRRVIINLSTEDGSATGGLDFSSISPSVAFPAGTSPGGPGSQQCAEFPITDDNLVERQEEFRVTATPEDDMVVFPRGRSSNVRIADNDSKINFSYLIMPDYYIFLPPAPKYRFTQPTYTVDEDDSPAQPAIELFSDTVLTFPATVRVTDIQGRTATGSFIMIRKPK